MKLTALVLSGTCKCGGDLMDTRTFSYDITSDTTEVACHGSCGKTFSMNRAPKTARVFTQFA